MNQGWECPKCGRVNAPIVLQCPCWTASVPSVLPNKIENWEKCPICCQYKCNLYPHYCGGPAGTAQWQWYCHNCGKNVSGNHSCLTCK